jgi:hypothetical protein
MELDPLLGVLTTGKCIGTDETDFLKKKLEIM